MQRTQPCSLRDRVQLNLFFLNCHHPMQSFFLRVSTAGISPLLFHPCFSFPRAAKFSMVWRNSGSKCERAFLHSLLPLTHWL